jgi:hypothetical protein
VYAHSSRRYTVPPAGVAWFSADYPIRKRSLKDPSRDTDLDGTTLEERWDMMWPLAVTAYAFQGEQDADAEELPRRIARLIRGKR